MVIRDLMTQESVDPCDLLKTKVNRVRVARCWAQSRASQGLFELKSCKMFPIESDEVDFVAKNFPFSELDKAAAIMQSWGLPMPWICNKMGDLISTNSNTACDLVCSLAMNEDFISRIKHTDFFAKLQQDDGLYKVLIFRYTVESYEQLQVFLDSEILAGREVYYHLNENCTLFATDPELKCDLFFSKCKVDLHSFKQI